MTTTTTTTLEDAVRRLGWPIRADRCPCPGHPGEAPAAVLDPRTRTFRCPRCGVAGDALDLIALARGIERDAARRWLEQGDEGDVRAAWEAFLRLCVSTGETFDAERRHLGVSEGTLRRLGARCVEDYRAVVAALTRSFTRPVLRASGLWNRRDHLIFYRHRLVLPWREHGRLVHLVGLGPGELQLRGRPCPAPWNLSALEATRGEVLVCSSVRDAVLLEEWGCPAVAVPEPPGLVEAWHGHFAKRKILVLVDPDRGGRPAAEDRAETLRPVAASVDVVDLPGRGDAASFFRGLDEGGGTPA